MARKEKSTQKSKNIKRSLSLISFDKIKGSRLFSNKYYRLARVDNLTGAWLIIVPALWGLSLAATSHTTKIENLFTVVLIIVGGLLARSAGCVWGDITDRKLDRKVARTSSRPVASGEIKVSHAYIFLFILLFAAAVILLFFNRAAIVSALLLIPLFIAYPFSKRWIKFPQLILGILLGGGVWIGWFSILADSGIGELIARRGYIGGFLPPILLHLSVMAWVIGYDTIYAIQDIDDDRKAGVNSLALHAKGNIHRVLTVCYAVSFLLALIASVSVPGSLGNASLMLIFGVLLAWQVAKVDVEDKALALRLFQSNAFIGIIVWLIFINL